MKEQLLEAFKENQRLKKEMSELEESILVEDILSHYTYADKEVLEGLRKQFSDARVYWLSNKISHALKQLKEKAHPEVLGVKYYKKYLDQLTVELTEEQKILIDTELMKAAKPNYIYATIRTDLGHEKERKVLKELYTLGVIAPSVTIPQMCDCFSGTDKLLGNKIYGESIYQFFQLEEGDDEGLEEELSGIDLSCYNCGEEVWLEPGEMLEQVKSSYEEPYYDRFKVIVEPDMTLDNL